MISSPLIPLTKQKVTTKRPRSDLEPNLQPNPNTYPKLMANWRPMQSTNERCSRQGRCWSQFHPQVPIYYVLTPISTLNLTLTLTLTITLQVVHQIRHQPGSTAGACDSVDRNISTVTNPNPKPKPNCRSDSVDRNIIDCNESKSPTQGANRGQKKINFDSSGEDSDEASEVE